MQLMAGMLLVPVVTAGYVGLTLFLFVPLLGLRRLFPRGAVVRNPAQARSRASHERHLAEAVYRVRLATSR
jgi:hypothetical protein